MLSIISIFVIFTISINYVTAQEPNSEIPVLGNDDLLDAYKDSYITKNAAEKFVQKIKKYQASHSGTEFQNFFDSIKFKPVKPNDKTFYDKKYFDYLPSDDEGGDSGDGALSSDLEPPPIEQNNKRHNRWKRQTRDYYFFGPPEPVPNRYYLPSAPAPVSSRFDTSPMNYINPNNFGLNNRGAFDLGDNLIFDYVYNPSFSRRPAFPSNSFNYQPAFQRPVAAAPPPPQRPARPVQPLTTARPIQQENVQKVYGQPKPGTGSGSGNAQAATPKPNTATTKRPSIFHSSDYDEDLEDVSNRFGEPVTEPKYCSWAINSCCNAANETRKKKCLKIFECNKTVEDACSETSVQEASAEIKNFLDAARKK